MKKINILKNNSIFSNTFVANINFFDLQKIAKLTVREDDNKKDSYQRRINPDRTKKIVKYIERSLFVEGEDKLMDKSDIVSLFPSALIVAFDSEIIETENEQSLDNLTIRKNGDSYELLIPEKMENKPVLIVDGQHRYVGVSDFFEKYPNLKNSLVIEFPVTILLNYDYYQQSGVFANVNFNQKQVNRSLYYDIFGEMPEDKNDITFVHFLSKYLNNDEDSPFKGMIKMLGDEKFGIITQSFISECIMPLVKKNGIFYKYFYEYKEGNNGKESFNFVLDCIKDFFNIIKENFIDLVPKKNIIGYYVRQEYKSIVFKTTGIGALFRLLNYIGIDNKSNKVYIKYLKEENIFNDPVYTQGAGKGMQDKLFKRIKDIIDYKKDVVGKMFDNSIINDIKLKDINGRLMNEISMENGTKTLINNEELEIIKNR